MSLEAFPHLHAETDHARQRYERLRNLYLYGSVDPADPDVEHYSRHGLAGLFDANPPQGYWVEVHEASVRGWGRVDPRDAALREAMRLLLTPGRLADHLSSSIATGIVADPAMSAMVALIDMAAKSGGPTGLDCMHHLLLL